MFEKYVVLDSICFRVSPCALECPYQALGCFWHLVDLVMPIFVSNYLLLIVLYNIQYYIDEQLSSFKGQIGAKYMLSSPRDKQNSTKTQAREYGQIELDFRLCYSNSWGSQNVRNGNLLRPLSIYAILLVNLKKNEIFLYLVII